MAVWQAVDASNTVTNLDDGANVLDFNRMAASFNASPSDWSSGDFNYDDVTNVLDFNLLAASFNQALPAPAALRPVAAGSGSSSPSGSGGAPISSELESDQAWIVA